MHIFAFNNFMTMNTTLYYNVPSSITFEFAFHTFPTMNYPYISLNHNFASLIAMSIVKILNIMSHLPTQYVEMSIKKIFDSFETS